MKNYQPQQIQKLKPFLNTNTMKNTNSQKLRLGLFVITGTVLFIVGVYLIGQRQNMFKKTFTISAYFQNVNGLQNGNNVRYSGIDIGTVKDITMVNDSTIKVETIKYTLNNPSLKAKFNTDLITLKTSDKNPYVRSILEEKL